MLWKIESSLPKGGFLCQLKGDERVEAGLHFESPTHSRGSVWTEAGPEEFLIRDEESFFTRAVRVCDAEGHTLLTAKVGWGDKCTLAFGDGRKVAWDFASDWQGFQESHRLLLEGEQEKLRLVPTRAKKSFSGAELRAPVVDRDVRFLSMVGFYLLLWREREDLKAAQAWKTFLTVDLLGELLDPSNLA